MQHGCGKPPSYNLPRRIKREVLPKPIIVANLRPDSRSGGSIYLETDPDPNAIESRYSSTRPAKEQTAVAQSSMSNNAVPIDATSIYGFPS